MTVDHCDVSSPYLITLHLARSSDHDDDDSDDDDDDDDDDYDYDTGLYTCRGMYIHMYECVYIRNEQLSSASLTSK